MFDWRQAVDESVDGFSQPRLICPTFGVKMNRGRWKNTVNRHEDGLLRPPEPEAVGSNPALPDL